MVVAAALAAAPGAAQPAPPVYHFGEIVVTGAAPRVVEQVTAVAVVTAEDIERAGARTVDEAIALLPGVAVRRGAEGVALIDLRGLRTRNVLLLLDGVPLNSSFDGLFDPGTLSVESIARIKLTRGAASVLYGPGGNGGVLDIVTRAAGEGTETSAGLEAGSAGSRDLRARAAWRRGAVGLVIAGSLFDQDSFELSGDFAPTPLEDGGRRLNSDRRDGAVRASLTVEPAAERRWGVNLGYRQSERGKPPVSEDFRLSPFAPRPRFERAEREALSLHAGLSHEAAGGWTLRPSLYLNRAREATDGFDDETFTSREAAGAFREEARTTILGGGLQAALRRGPRGLLTVALDAREERWRADGFEVAGAAGGGGGGGGGGGQGSAGPTRPIAADRAVRISSLAVEYELAPGGRWSAVAGGGLARQEREDARGRSGFNLLLGGSVALAPRLSLRASAARRIRFPTLRDLYAADRGNPELDAERTVAYEIGLDHRGAGGRRHLQLALFRVAAADFIERVPGGAVGNLQETRFQGIELAGRHRLGGRSRLEWSYTGLDAENRSPGAGTGKTQNRPEHKATVVAERRLRGGLRLRGEVLFVADRYALTRSRPARAAELGDYAVVGARLSLPLRRGRLRLSARVGNLLDADYAESIGFPAPGRTVFLGVAASGVPGGARGLGARGEPGADDG